MTRLTFTLIHLCTLLTLSVTRAYAQSASAGVEHRPLSADPVGAGEYLQVLLGLALIVVLIFGFAWFMRRFGHLPAGGQGSIRLLGGVSMGQRERVVLLQVGDTQLLVGVAPGYLRTLHVLAEPIAQPSAEQRTRAEGFAERLQSALKRGVKS